MERPVSTLKGTKLLPGTKRAVAVADIAVAVETTPIRRKDAGGDVGADEAGPTRQIAVWVKTNKTRQLTHHPSPDHSVK